MELTRPNGPTLRTYHCLIVHTLGLYNLGYVPGRRGDDELRLAVIILKRLVVCNKKIPG